MSRHEDHPLRLDGIQVAFTGRLAALARAEAIALVRARGGRCVRSVSRDTGLLIVGQAGLPLTSRGGLTGNLRRARKQQELTGTPTILTEEAFFDRLGLDQHAGDVRRLYSPAQLCQALGVTRAQLRAWSRERLILPVKTVQGIAFFDFRQATAIRTLATLTRSGVTLVRIRRALESLQRCLPGVEHPLERLALLENDGKMIFRLNEGMLADASGQLRFDFADEPASVSQAVEMPPSAEQACSEGLVHEEAGRLDEAALAYRQALRIDGPDPQLCFNLANILARQGHFDAAVERYWQALEIDPTFAEAWNNLGNALVDLEQAEEAVAAYREALEIEPSYGGAHYNLADVLDQCDQSEAARKHWQAFLRLEPQGAWSDYARRRLADSEHGEVSPPGAEEGRELDQRTTSTMTCRATLYAARMAVARASNWPSLK